MSSNLNSDLEEVVSKAGAAYSEGRYSDALSLYEKAVLSNPSNGVLLANMSAILLKMDRPQEALEHAEKAIQLTPGWAKAYYRCGEVHRRLGSLTSAVLSLCHGITIDPDNNQLSTSLLEVAEELFENFPINDLQRLNLHNSWSVVFSTIGQLFLSKDQMPEAMEILKWALHMHSPSLKLKESTISALATAKYRSGDFRRACDYFEQQLEICSQLGGDTIPIHENISRSALKCSLYQLALLHKQKKVITMEGVNRPCEVEYLEVADLMLKTRNIDGALEIFERLTMSEDENVATRAAVGLGLTYASQGDFTSALSSFEGLSVCDDSLRISVIECKNRSLIAEGKTDEAIEMLTQEMERPSTRNQPEMLGHLFALLCDDHLLLGHVALADKLAKGLLKISRGKSLPNLEAKAYLLLSKVYSERGDSKSTIALLQKYSQMEILPDEKATTFIRISQLHSDDEDIELSLLAALKCVSKTEATSLRLQTHSMLHRFYKRTNQLGKAQEQLELEKALLSEDISPEIKSLVYEDVSDALADQGCSGEQIEVLEAGLAEAQDANNLFREAECCEKLGLAYDSQERYLEASGYFEQQLAVNKQMRSAAGMAKGFTNLAKLFYKQRMWEKCKQHIKSALTLARILMDADLRVELFLLMAECEINMKNLEVAKVVTNKALRICEASSKREEMAKCLRMGADICVQMGQNKQAQKYLQQHLSLFDRVADLEERSHCLLSLAEMKMSEGLTAASLQMIRAAVGVAHQQKISVVVRAARLCREMKCEDEAVRMMSSCVERMDRLAVGDVQCVVDEILHYQTSRITLILLQLLHNVDQSLLLRVLWKLLPLWPEKADPFLRNLVTDDELCMSDEELFCCRLGIHLALLKTDNVQLESDEEIFCYDGLDVIKLLRTIGIPSTSELQSLISWIKITSNRDSPHHLNSTFWSQVTDFDLCSFMDYLNCYSERDGRALESFDLQTRAHLQLSKGLFNLMEIADELPLLDKILISVMNSQIHDAQTAHKKYLSSFSPSLQMTVSISEEERLRYASAFLLLGIFDCSEQIFVAEQCRTKIFGVQQPTMENVHNLSNTFEFFFRCGRFLFIWRATDFGSTRLFYRICDNHITFYDEILATLIHRRVIPLYRKTTATNLAMGDVPEDVQKSVMLPFLSQLPKVERNIVIRSMLLCDSSTDSKNDIVSMSSEISAVTLKKFGITGLLMWNMTESVPPKVILGLEYSPVACFIYGRLTSEFVCSLFARGTKCLVECSERIDEQFISTVSSSESIQWNDLPIRRIWGSTEYLMNSHHHGLAHIRSIVAEDVDSFLPFSRVIQEQSEIFPHFVRERVGRLGELMKELNDGSWSSMKPWFTLTDTKTINLLNQHLENETIDEWILNNPSFSREEVVAEPTFPFFFQLFYEDHLYVAVHDDDDREDVPEIRDMLRTRHHGRRIRLRDGGSSLKSCTSDGEETTSLRDFSLMLRRSARSLRASATFLGIEEPKN